MPGRRTRAKSSTAKASLQNPALVVDTGARRIASARSPARSWPRASARTMRWGPAV